MYRRQRRQREIPFSFDSFLDVVANVVGIIIRLILVVWVSARSYSSVSQYLDKPAAIAPKNSVQPAQYLDPLQDELARRRRDLALAQARLLEQLRELQQSGVTQSAAQEKIEALA